MADDAKLREKVEVLDGARGRGLKRSAVRHEDLTALLQIPEKLTAAHAAGAAPTAAEHNALVDDLDFIRARLFEVQAAIRIKFLK